jgi:transposase InsO family protein
MLIDEYRGQITIRRMCELLNISRDAYYSWNTSGKIPTVDFDDASVLRAIKEIVLEFSGYGYRRVTAELGRRNLQVNHKKVLSIMRENNLTMKKKRKRFSTTNSNHILPIYPNLTKDLIPSHINQLWVADITYIRLYYEFAYLAAILDSFSRKVVGWSLKESLDHELTLSALRMALVRRDIAPGLIHHSDRGVQYACRDYTDLLKKNSILISMASTGNPYENAQAESFIATLKREEVYLSEYDDVSEALLCIGHFIEDVYNTKRLHSSLGYLPPAEFERDLVTIN